MMPSSHRAPVAALVLALAAGGCIDAAESDEGDDLLLGAALCGIVADEPVPGSWGWDRSLAIDAEGVVHLASSMQYATRGGDGLWRLAESGFDAEYFTSPHLAAGPGGVVVAHTGNGLRVARGGGDAWTTIFERSQVQCSGNPYVDRFEVANDGRVLVDGSEGAILFRADGSLEELAREPHRALDAAGTIVVRGGDPLVIEDDFGETVLEGPLSGVRALGANAGGDAAIVLVGDEPARIMALLRTPQGTWSKEPSPLLDWVDDVCSDDPANGERCVGTHTGVSHIEVHTAGRLAVTVMLRVTDFDLTWKCWPMVGVSGCYMGWDGTREARYEVHVGTVSSGALHLAQLPVPQPGEDDPGPLVTRDARGAHHVVVGDRYLRMACGGG